jgi:hypothetical protein
MTRQPNYYVRRNSGAFEPKGAYLTKLSFCSSHKQTNMSSDAKGSSATAGKGFRARMEHYLYSGDKKHVMAGIVLISAVFAVPWYLMNRGSIFHFPLSLSSMLCFAKRCRFAAR